MSGGHGAGGSSNKRVALLISVLALFLAFSETLGKASQTERWAPTSRRRTSGRSSRRARSA